MSDDNLLKIIDTNVRCMMCDSMNFLPLVTLRYDENGRLTQHPVGHQCAGCQANLPYEIMKLHTHMLLQEKWQGEHDAALAASQAKREQLHEEAERSVAEFQSSRAAFEKAHPAPERGSADGSQG